MASLLNKYFKYNYNGDIYKCITEVEHPKRRYLLKNIDKAWDSETVSEPRLLAEFTEVVYGNDINVVVNGETITVSALDLANCIQLPKEYLIGHCDGKNFILRKGSNEGVSHTCKDFALYEGFTEVYHYCKECGNKRL